jgi:hypothetical protein
VGKSNDQTDRTARLKQQMPHRVGDAGLDSLHSATESEHVNRNSFTKHDQDVLNINKVCFASTRYGENGSLLFRQESEHGFKFRIDIHRRPASQSKT